MLKGVKIIDFTNYLPGPYASLRLAELGAEIIKVEPLKGDPARSTGLSKNGNGLVYLAHNRQKKSIALNLKAEEGRHIALGLMAKADAVLESFRPGVMAKLGLGYEAVCNLKPDIVYCSITGYGDKGPMRGLGSHDLNYMSMSGLLSQLTNEQGRPVHPSITIADYVGGMAASERVLAGLVSRGLTGKGSYHCISITDVMASLMANHVLIEKETGYPNGVSVLNGELISYALYETKDGRHVSLAALEPKFWRNFCIAVNREEWIPAHFSKLEPENPIFTEMMQLFKSKTMAEWTEFGRQVDCCLAPVLRAGELAADDYFRMNGLIYDAPWGDRQVKMHGDMAGGGDVPPPEKGADTVHILKDLLNVSEQQIAEWKRNDVI
ncbi:CaiB/BaiF CoA transferase family protein [Bacillus sp. T33-2]|uniref:CaiB/BaiF CoA transferase family protein n=1 Tax=Bacillus sp. T33-2 TaxID=2054168 RepID=UPI000C78D1C2|nr:CaiB/BaiF CoA-transferase family protein [Bacillus sp. T33-2]PLR95384.1 CoA transferase [Bacillus sp. T33-2]